MSEDIANALLSLCFLAIALVAAPALFAVVMTGIVVSVVILAAALVCDIVAAPFRWAFGL